VKTLSLALVVSLLIVSPSWAETIVDGVVYTEITDLGMPRRTPAQPQLGMAAAYRVQNQAPAPVAPIAYTAQLPPPPGHLVQPGTTIAPADARPTLTAIPQGSHVQSPVAGQTTVQNAVATPYAYGYGYTSVGSPQKVVQVMQPVGYTNTLPQQQVTYVQPVAYAQPIATAQPITTLQTSTAYNPYVQTKGVPWRPIVPIRSMPDNYVVGQGIVGQPKVYVPSQPVRNFLRYITP
jgi:hypothetical protein